MKVRQNLYIDRALSDALEALAAGPRGNKSHLVNDALADWLSRRGTKQVDDLFKVRLDRMSRELHLTRRDVGIVLESQFQLIRYILNVMAPLPLDDAAARAVGRGRFGQFLLKLGEQLASGRPTFDPDRTDEPS